MITCNNITYNPVLNSYYYKKQNAMVLKKFIERFCLLIYNELRHAIVTYQTTLSQLSNKLFL